MLNISKIQKVEGGNAILTCRPSKDSLTNKYPRVTWFINGKELNLPVNGKLKKGGTKLILKKLTSLNGGKHFIPFLCKTIRTIQTYFQI